MSWMRLPEARVVLAIQERGEIMAVSYDAIKKNSTLGEFICSEEEEESQ